ncbi:MAG TPA: RHS repeat-associated core domain-containing protein, partial [Candidatus Dormibacteraeota bacterium]|nr:RHS repeat-associated core domain-containing protein [Candidatus Dormibacteraeota bacterium]
SVISTYSYDAYGNVVSSNIGVADTSIRYDGQLWDYQDGLYYLRARFYDPATAQFISRDPAVASTREPYGYVGDSPLNGSDSSGLFAVGALAFGAGELGIGAIEGAFASALLPATIVGGGIWLGVRPHDAGGALADDPAAYMAAHGAAIQQAKRSKQSGKEAATDIPSWADQPTPGEGGKDYAGRNCDRQFGAGNYSTGPGSDYNKLKKYGDRKYRPVPNP